jgi:hypothetical protein
VAAPGVTASLAKRSSDTAASNSEMGSAAGYRALRGAANARRFGDPCKVPPGNCVHPE